MNLVAGNSVHVVWNDFHRPYHDPLAMNVAEQLVKYIQPDYIHYNGDIIDFYPISKFDKKPWKKTELQSELDNVQAMFKYHSVIFPKTEKFYLIGNHEDRLRKYLWTKAEELSQLRCLELEELLNLNEYGITMVDYEEGIFINELFYVIHGDLIRKYSSYTARGMMEKHGGSGVMGHTHRGGVHYHRNRFGEFGWWENYCLCDLNPDYIQYPDWQQGISVIQFIKDRFFISQIPIIHGKAIYGGKLFEVEKRIK